MWLREGKAHLFPAGLLGPLLPRGPGGGQPPDRTWPRWLFPSLFKTEAKSLHLVSLNKRGRPFHQNEHRVVAGCLSPTRALVPERLRLDSPALRRHAGGTSVSGGGDSGHEGGAGGWRPVGWGQLLAGFPISQGPSEWVSRARSGLGAGAGTK